MINKIVSYIMVICLFCAVPQAVFADETVIASPHAVLMEASTGTIIYENLELIHHNQKWLEQIMKVHGINLQEIVILYVDGQQTIHFYLKNELKRDFI